MPAPKGNKYGKNGGRPTIFTPELLKKVDEYVNGGWVKVGDMIPSIAGLAVYLGTNREMIYEWSKQEDKKEFSYIVKGLLTNQERVLSNNGLNGKFNPNISKLILGKHGYSDKQDITSAGKPVPILGGLTNAIPNNDSNTQDSEPKE
jgi:hypothetical protein